MLSLVHAAETMAAESTIYDGDVPQTLSNPLREAPTFAIAADAFLLKLPNGLRFHYARGKGVAVERPDTVTDAEVTLFFNGSVYGAIAWINGLVPLHASAVEHDGKVYAVTGHSGAGKSTLAAALAQRGFRLFADDVLVLHMAEDGTVQALPGHKTLKLWGNALKLTGLPAGDQVRPEMDKYFVAPPAGSSAHMLPLASISFIDDRSHDSPSIRPLAGSQSLVRTRAAFYRPHFCAAVAGKLNQFGFMAALAKSARLSIFERSRLPENFKAGVDFYANAIRSGDA